MKRNTLNLALTITALALAGCSNETPEAAVKSFFEATKDGKEDKAKKQVTENMLESWDLSYTRNQQLHENYKVTMTVTDTKEVSADTARVKVRWKYVDESGTGSSSITFRVKRIDGNWLVDEAGVSFLDEFPEAENDSRGKTPYDYAEEYYAAMNEEDFAALRALHADSYVNHFIRNVPRSEKGKSESERFKYKMNQRMRKSKELKPKPDWSGYLSNNAEGVFSVSYHLTYTDEFARKKEKEALEKYGLDQPIKGMDTELCFKMIDGVWKITSKGGI